VFSIFKVLKGGTGAIAYSFLRGREGLATKLVGFFSQDPAGYPPGTTVTTPALHGEIHIIGAFVLVGTLVFMALFGMAQQHGGAAGLFERLAVSTEPIWGVLLLARLWAGTRLMRPPTQATLPARL
jgi:hypothetical protein